MRNLKIIFSIMLLISLALTCSACQNNSTVNDSQSSKTETTDENKSSDNLDSNNIDKNIEIHVPANSIWSQEDCAKAEDFARNVISYINSKDMNSLSKVMLYPIPLKIDGKLTTLNNEKEFTAIPFEKIFTSPLIENVNKCTTIFNNWRGFMLTSDDGGMYNIWFSPFEDDDTMLIYGINN